MDGTCSIYGAITLSQEILAGKAQGNTWDI